jgi:hypothetical protein
MFGRGFTLFDEGDVERVEDVIRGGIPEAIGLAVLPITNKNTG